jgi:hypothetical protein
MQNQLFSLLVCTSSLLWFTNLPAQGNQTTTVAGVNSLKQNVIQAFLRQANDPKSQFHQKLLQLNQETIDGRNQQGVIPKTLTVTDLQVILIDGEDQFGAYCQQIPNKPDHRQCENGVTETYLMQIPYRYRVHKATSYPSFKFVVKAEKNSAWKVDDKEKEYDRSESITVSPPVDAIIQAGSEKY